MSGVAGKFISNFVDVILQPIAELLLVVAVLVFIWGLVEFIQGADNEVKRTEGRSHMLWGLVGIFIMISAIPIINVALKTFKINQIDNSQIHLDAGEDLSISF